MTKVLVRATTRVISVEERFRVARGYKRGDETVLEQKSLGWFIRITESSAIGVGPNKPDVSPGDEIILTLEKP